ncbi:MAG TPA: bifunctional YncE family protein/alkaline phosphatase family protein [Paludibaculum sp.]|jgi:YVTN family beta-propeller protein
MKKWFFGVVVVLAGAGVAAQRAGVFEILATTAGLGKQPGGAWLIPSNQLVQPAGITVEIKGRPVDLALDGERGLLAVLNSRGVEIRDAVSGAMVGEVKSRSTSYAGVAFRPGTREVWASEATRNGPDSFLVAELNERGAPVKESRSALAPHPVPVGIAFSGDGKLAFMAFSRENAVAVFDAEQKKLLRRIPVGVAPHGVVFSKTQNRIFVSNRGGRLPQAGDTLAPTSGGKIVSDPLTGASVSGTVSVIDAKTDEVREVVVGLAPAGLALSPDGKTVAVANAHSDSLTLINAETLATTVVKIQAYPEGTAGSIPAQVAFSPDGQTIYVLCGGTNAIAVVRSGKLAGALPTGWFPSGIVVDGKGVLKVLSIKGTGNTALPAGNFRSTAYEGTLQSITAPRAAEWQAGLREVKAANQPRFAKAGGVENLRSLGIEHVFLIIKENRTYDQVFGDLKQGNGDERLALYGREVTPNHHALAEKYVLLDNFHTSSSISFDGHQWLMMAFVSDYTQRAFAASPRGYAWDMSDALTVSPSGFFWRGAPPQVTVRVFGEFCLPGKYDPATQSAEDITERKGRNWTDYWKLYQSGAWMDQVGCSTAGLPALKSIMSARYPQDDTVITDQIRASEFLRELAEREKSGEMANINILTLTSDHTNGTSPSSPTPKAMVADNDLALGRMVEGISKSRFWKKSLILVVEDDAQDGLDHVNGHRTVALMIGPNVRRGAVDTNHYTQISMLRTIQELFRIPAQTSTLKAARAMTSVFTPHADASPYAAIANRIPLDQMNPPAKALRGRARWAAEESARMNWADVDDIPSDTLNRILWWDARGYDTPYPGDGKSNSHSSLSLR